MKKARVGWTRGNNGYDPRPRPGFTKVVSFTEAFPEIAKVTIGGEEVSGDPASKPLPVRYTERTLPGEHIPCRNPKCQKGGFKIGMVLRTLIEHKATQSNTSALCKGFEPELAPDNRTIYRKCMHLLQFDIRISYRPLGRKTQ